MIQAPLRCSFILKKNEELFNTPRFGAVRTRFELVTPCVTGRYSNQLN